MKSFQQLVEERRSANNFLPGHPITEKDLNDIFRVLKFTPSAFNLQHTRYAAVIDPDLKMQLKEAANGQYKVGAASGVIVVLGDTFAYQETAQIYEGLLNLGVLSEEQYNDEVNDVISFYKRRGISFQRDEAIRNASLSAMMFMLAAKDAGWDTCPMIGFNPTEVRRILNIPEHFEVVLMIAIGKEKVESRRPRGYRKPVGELVKYY